MREADARDEADPGHRPHPGCFTVLLRPLFVLSSSQDAVHGFAALASAVIGIRQEWGAK